MLEGSFFYRAITARIPHIVVTLGRLAKDHTVYVLIGSEGGSLKSNLEKRAQEAGITVYFIDGGFGMMKRVKRALAQNYPVFVEIDVPWGKTQDCNVSYPFFGGKLHAKDALFRMMNRLNVKKNFVLSLGGQQSITIMNYGDLSQNECFAVFEDAVRHSPQQYERLFQMHHYFEAGAPSDAAVVWQGQSNQYILHAADMKAWAIARPIAPGVGQRAAIQKLIGREVGHVVSL